MKLEVVVFPVSDVEKADASHRGLGWRVDADVNVGGFRLVQMTPPALGALFSSAPSSRQLLLDRFVTT